MLQYPLLWNLSLPIDVANHDYINLEVDELEQNVVEVLSYCVGCDQIYEEFVETYRLWIHIAWVYEYIQYDGY